MTKRFALTLAPILVGIGFAFAPGLLPSELVTEFQQRLGENYLTIYYLVLASLGLLAFWITLQATGKESSSQTRSESGFKNLWPKLSRQLKEELDESIASATQVMQLATDDLRADWPHAHNPVGLRALAGRNWRFIRGFDRGLARQLAAYLKASSTLQAVAYRYKDVRGGHGIFDKDADLPEIRNQMWREGRELEAAADSLREVVERLDDGLL